MLPANWALQNYSFCCGTAIHLRDEPHPCGAKLPQAYKHTRGLDTAHAIWYKDAVEGQQIVRYCGREFSAQEIDWIRNLIAQDSAISRFQISKRFCEYADWRKPDGGLKDMSCRVALLKMARAGVLRLPVPKNPQGRPDKKVSRTREGARQADVHKKAGEFDLHLRIVDAQSSSLWNELIGRYHYLGYTPLSGAQLRYFVDSQEGIVALLSFSAAAWSTQPRDTFIGWGSAERKKNLQYVVNNSRFLILPWIHSKGLASRILSMAARRLPADWQARYNYRPVLLETFVERDRFEGTCYKAAGWQCVGETKGRGKLDVRNEYSLPVKTIWLMPLSADFRARLLQ